MQEPVHLQLGGIRRQGRYLLDRLEASLDLALAASVTPKRFLALAPTIPSAGTVWRSARTAPKASLR
jgi:hypothetical protein